MSSMKAYALAQYYCVPAKV